MKIINIKNCPFVPTHIDNKPIRKIFFNKIAIIY